MTPIIVKWIFGYVVFNCDVISANSLTLTQMSLLDLIMLLDALTQDSTKRASRLGWESVHSAGGCSGEVSRVQAADCSTAASHRARQSAAAAPPIPAQPCSGPHCYLHLVRPFQYSCCFCSSSLCSHRKLRARN